MATDTNLCKFAQLVDEHTRSPAKWRKHSIGDPNDPDGTHCLAGKTVVARRLLTPKLGVDAAAELSRRYSGILQDIIQRRTRRTDGAITVNGFNDSARTTFKDVREVVEEANKIACDQAS